MKYNISYNNIIINYNNTTNNHLQFNFSLSMQPFEHPYCTMEGVIFDLMFVDFLIYVVLYQLFVTNNRSMIEFLSISDHNILYIHTYIKLPVWLSG